MSKTSNDKKIVSIRHERNSDLIRRMKNGESLTSYDSSASWFPPRPTIQKDEKAQKRLYGDSKTNKDTAEEATEPTLVVLPLAQ